jgi:hypothetical protein
VKAFITAHGGDTNPFIKLMAISLTATGSQNTACMSVPFHSAMISSG